MKHSVQNIKTMYVNNKLFLLGHDVTHSCICLFLFWTNYRQKEKRKEFWKASWTNFLGPFSNQMFQRTINESYKSQEISSTVILQLMNATACLLSKVDSFKNRIILGMQDHWAFFFGRQDDTELFCSANKKKSAFPFLGKIVESRFLRGHSVMPVCNSALIFGTRHARGV